MRPRIAIPAPTSADADYNRRCWPQYASAVRAAGGDAVMLSLTEGSATSDLIESCNGFLLPGSPADIDPVLYGQGRDPSTAPSDAAREDCDRRLLERPKLLEAPVFGICIGLQ